MALDLIRDYKPELVKMIKNTLNDPAAQARLSQYEAELNALIVRIHRSESRNQQLSKTYSNLLNQLYAGVVDQSLSAIHMVETQSNELNQEMQQIINELFQKEHEILDYLSQSATETAKYAIYYSSEQRGRETVLRGEISAKELYNSGQMTITNQGITLERENIQKMFESKGTTRELTPEEIQKYMALAETAIKHMEAALGMLRAELEHIERQKRREHLGDDLWRKYKNLQRLVGSQYSQDIIKSRYLYGLMTSGTMRGPTLRGSFMNRGHIYEALERYIQGSTKGLEEVLGESIGHDPWWTQGDVGNIQVKSMVGTQSTQVKVASMSSILRVAEFLQTLLKARRSAMQQMDPFVERQLDQQIAHGSPDFSGTFIDKTINDLLKALPGRR